MNMEMKMGMNSFGARLRYFRRRARDPERGGPLTQERLTHLMYDVCGLVYSYGAISDWERGKSQVPKDHRSTLVGLVTTLGKYGGILSRQEADDWLATGNYRLMDEDELDAVHQAEVIWSDLGPQSVDKTAIEPAGPMLAPPLPPQPIIGRERALREMKNSLLAREFVAVSAVRGLPGVGKTTLALALAHDADIQAAFPDGILWIGLGRDPDTYFHLGLWAQALGVPDGELATMTAVGMRTAAIRSLLSNRAALLIIDDVWQAKHGQWFQLGGKDCAHIITTRLPAVGNAIRGARHIVVDTLSEPSSIQLLSLLAPQVYQQFPAEIHRLAVSSNGLALALMLMGNYLRQQAASGQPRRVERALYQLQDQSFRLQIEMHQTGAHAHPSLNPEQDASLATIIGISEQALPGREQQEAFRCLGLFPAKPNSFAENAALAVMDAGIKTIDILVDTGLVETSGQERYQLHQSIVEYLHFQGAPAGVQERFVHFYASWLQSYKEDFLGVGRELDNIIAAVTIALNQQFNESLIEIVRAVFPFLESRGLWTLIDHWLGEAVGRALQIREPVKAIDLLRQQGRSWEVRRDREKADRYWERAIVIAREHGETELLVSLLAERSIAASTAKRYEQARDYLQQALEAATAADYPRGVSMAYGYLGRVEHQTGNYSAAITHLDASLVIARQHNLDALLCGLLILRGAAATYAESADSAEQFYLEALDYARTVGRKDQLSAILTNLGEIETKRGQDARAIAYLEEALDIAHESGSPAREAHIRKDLGILTMRQGDADKAQHHFETGLQLAQAEDNEWLANYIEVHWGELLLKTGHITQAEGIFSRLIENLPPTGKEKYMRAIVLFGQAQIAQKEGRPEEALPAAAESEQILQEMGHERAAEVSAFRKTLSRD